MPFITFVNGTVVTPAWLNGVATNDGTVSFKGLILDGTGGASVAATARQVEATGGALLLKGSSGVTVVSGSGPFTVARVKAGGTAYTGAEAALSGTWGAGATYAIEGTDSAGKIDVLAAGVPGANPTITITWKDGPYAAIGTVFGDIIDGTLGSEIDHRCSYVAALNILVITYRHTPVAGDHYRFNWRRIETA